MSVKRESDGRRVVQLETEVPGTPDAVWRKIATGEGISSWFAPTEVDERPGGGMTFRFGGGIESAGTITAWEPTRRFAYEERDWAEGAPPLATEFTMEARAGGTCTVRLVHSLFTDSADWDDQLEGFEVGWPVFFEVLRISLERFGGRPCAAIRVMQSAPGPRAELWRSITSSLGLSDVRLGSRVDTARSAAPRIAGEVRTVRPDHHDIVVLLEAPVGGAAVFGAYEWGGTRMISASLYFYGYMAEEVLTRDREAWQTWIEHTARAGTETSTRG